MVPIGVHFLELQVSSFDVEFCWASIDEDSAELCEQFWWEQMFYSCQELIMIAMCANVVAADASMDCC
jgi:hypothetical protein